MATFATLCCRVLIWLCCSGFGKVESGRSVICDLAWMEDVNWGRDLIWRVARKLQEVCNIY